MFNKLFILLSSSKYFWKVRHWVIQIKFWVEKTIYFVRYRFRDKRENTSSFVELLKVTLSGLVISILSVLVLIRVDPFLAPLYKYLGIKITNGQEYTSFFATVGGIGGVFIGLYYAAISTVSASVYSHVANNIRALLLKERIGNVYMRYLSFITFLSLVIMTVHILFHIYIGAGVIIILVLSGIGIIGFVKLGQRAFYMFDPTTLSRTIFYEMHKYLQMVIVGGYRWNDQSFQSHAHELAAYNVDTIETLAAIVKTSPHLAGKSYFDLIKNLMTFLIFYQAQKSKIHPKSSWYETIYVHRNWYQTDESSLNIAHTTGTQLNPDKEFDYLWIENRFLPIVNECVKLNLESNNQNLTFSLIQYFEKFVEVTSKNGDMKNAIRYIKELEDSAFDSVKEKNKEYTTAKEYLIVVGCYELLVTAIINAFLSFLKTFEIYTRGEISKRLHKINWKSEKYIYKNDFPNFCTEHIQWFYERINFELKVEGKIVTPNWYQTELMSLHIHNKLIDDVNLVFSSIFILIKKWKEKFSEKDFKWIYSAILSREWELFHKIERGLINLEKISEDLFKNKKIEGLDWKAQNWEEIKINIEAKRVEILTEMSKKSVELSFEDKPNEFPDYQGQFLHTMSESTIDAFCENDIKLLNSIFTEFFYGCLIKFDDLKPVINKLDWRIQQKYKIAVAPLLDLIEISGYGYLMAEFYSNQNMWQLVKQTWDKYLEKEPKSKLNVISLSISMTQNSIEIAYREIVRTTWRQKIERTLSSLKRITSYEKGFPIRRPEEHIKHNSPLVRVIAGSYLMSMFDGIDIFSSYYLSENSNSKDLLFSRNTKQLKNSVEREEKRGNVEKL